MAVGIGEKRGRDTDSARTSAGTNGSNAWKDMGPSEYDERETDRMLSEKLLGLSFKERNRINEEIHGIDNAFPEEKEDPEALQLALWDMENELERILENDNDGLKVEHITTNRNLRLTFLRVELFHIKKAATRLAMYTKLVRSQCACRGGISGCNCGSTGHREHGGRIIAEKWFTRDEYAELKKGAIQMMPFRDQSGRRIVIVLSACFKIPTPTRLKILTYLLVGASEDIETQKKGLVIMVWPGMCHSVTPSNTNLLYSLYNRGLSSLAQGGIPMRCVCIHFANPSSPLMKLIRIFIVMVMKDEYRLRVNVLDGTMTELKYKILGFGINPEMIPVSESGTIKTRNFLQWMETFKSVEHEPYGSSITTAGGRQAVDCPGTNDVLFHRGKSCQYHPGNVAFRGMLESKKRQHLAANQTMKKEIAWEIMAEVERRKGRFLSWDKSGWWVEFNDRTEVRHKVATSLRDFNKKARAANNRQNTHSSTSKFRMAKKQKTDHSSDSDSACSQCTFPLLTK